MTSSPISSSAPTGSGAVWPLLLVAFLGTFAFGLANVAVPTVGAAWHLSPGASSLVLGVFSAVFAAAVLPGGRWGDRNGRRRVLVIGLALALAAGIVTVFAPSYIWLVVARAVQGLGFGVAIPQVLGTIHAAFVGAKRSRALTGFAASGGVGTAAGLVLGGVMTSAGGPDGFRWAFGLVACATLIALIGAGAVAETCSDDGRTVDLPGTIFIALALVSLVGGLSLGPAMHWWPLPAILLFGAAIFGTLFWLCQALRADSRRVAVLLPPSVLRVPGLRYGMLLALTFFGGYGAFMYNYSALTQSTFGAPAWLSGLGLLGFSAAFFIGSVASSRLNERWGSSTLGRAGWMQLGALLLVAVGSLIGLGPVPWMLATQVPLLLAGFVQALQFGPLVSTIMNHVPTQLAGLTGGLLSAVQQAALALGVSVIGGVYTFMASAVEPVMAFTLSVGLQAICTLLFVLLARLLRSTSSSAAQHEQVTSSPERSR